MKNRIIKRICDITIYEILSIRCVKDELRCYMIKNAQFSALQRKIERCAYIAQFTFSDSQSRKTNVIKSNYEDITI